MTANFINQLRPVNDFEKDEWDAVLEVYRQRFGVEPPVLFWYLSSGFDLRALVHFNEKDTSEVYHTPTVDLFIYSDYGGGVLPLMRRYYDQLDHGPVCLYKDYGPTGRGGLDGFIQYMVEQERQQRGNLECRTHIQLEQMIPLRFFSDEEAKSINSSYSLHIPHFGCIFRARALCESG